MKAAIILLLCSSVMAIEWVDGKAVLSHQERARMPHCDALGGCFVVTRSDLNAMVEKVIEIAIDEARKNPPTCRRDIGI